MVKTILNFNQLTAPIAVDNPAGSDIRLNEAPDSLYQKLKEIRLNARAVERQIRQGIEKDTKPDWEQVRHLAEELLTTQSKDLEVAAWLVEALLRQQAFAGLRDGFRLIRELIGLYWDSLHPLPDEEGLITRIAPLTGLNGEETDGTLIVPIALVPLTQGKSEGPFALWQYQQALEQLKIVDPEKRAQRESAGVVTMEKMTVAVSETSTPFFTCLVNEITSAIDEFQKLNNLLEQKCQQDAPPSSRVLSQLNACLDCVKTIAKPVLPKVKTQEKTVALSGDGNDVAVTLNKPVLDQTTDAELTREDVLQSLLEAAAYFRQTEPHSPLSYMIERTVRWGKLSLPELMRELVKDEQAWGQVCNLTGIN